MRRLTKRLGVALLLVLLAHLAGADQGWAQDLDLRPGDRVMAHLAEPGTPPLEGSVSELWEDGFAVRLRGARTGSAPRRVDLTDLSSLQRSRRLGGRAQKGALIGGAALGLVGFSFGYCFQLFSDGCAEDFETGVAVGLVMGLPGALLGAGIGALIGHYGPFEPISLDASAPSSEASRFRMQVMPGESGGVGLRFAMAVGGGA